MHIHQLDTKPIQRTLQARVLYDHSSDIYHSCDPYLRAFSGRIMPNPVVVDNNYMKQDEMREKRLTNSVYHEAMYEVPLQYELEDQQQRFQNGKYNHSDKPPFGVPNNQYHVYRSNHPYVL